MCPLLAESSIAVVGVACRYPDAADPPELLEVCATGRRAFRRLPTGRARDESPGVARGRAQRAAVICGWRFDRDAFGVTEVTESDRRPGHWLALETAAKALAAAGFPGGRGLGPWRTRALFASPWRATELEVLLRRYLDIGGDPGTPADVRPAVGHSPVGVHDAEASASSLLAVIEAGELLLADAADLVLAGGVEAGLDPSRLAGDRAVAVEEMRIYDEQPTGYLPGEGCGAVVLMRAADACEAGLPVFAEIIGWGRGTDHLRAMRHAFEGTGIEPAEVALIEGAGLATAAADEAELGALAEARAGSGRTAAFGSVTANIGQTGAAAGVAGLIKAVLALGTGMLPPATGVGRAHRLIRDGAARLRLSDAPLPWPDGPRLAGVNACTPTGRACAHLLLGHLPRTTSARVKSPRGRSAARRPALRVSAAPAGRCTTFLLRARSRPLLAAMLARVAEIAPLLSDAELTDLAGQLACQAEGAPDSPVRAALVAHAQDELAAAARQAIRVLPGLGPGQLRTAPDVCVAERRAGSVTLLLADPRADADRLSWPAALRRELDTLRWLDQLAVHAQAAIGFGLGEIAGLAWAGVLSEADAAELTARREQLQRASGVRVLVSASRTAAAGQDYISTPQPFALAASIAGLRFRPPLRRLYSPHSAATDGLVTAGHAEEVALAADDEPARLADTLAAAVSGAALAAEIGPPSPLAATAGRVRDVPVISVGKVPGDHASAARAAAALFAAGALGRPRELFADCATRPFDLWSELAFIADPTARATGGSRA